MIGYRKEELQARRKDMQIYHYYKLAGMLFCSPFFILKNIYSGIKKIVKRYASMHSQSQINPGGSPGTVWLITRVPNIA